MPRKPKVDNETNLFASEHAEAVFRSSPLSVRMRPRDFSEYVGQSHILGPGKLLTRAIESDRLSSLILYGPPGTGKTTLAHCVSNRTKANFQRINAVSSNVEELRQVIQGARNRREMNNTRTILFIDEIHRFNKAQQDVLMPDIEDGTLVLIGATVMNPFFSLTGPLVSRSLIFELKPLTKEELILILEKALKDEQRGLGKISVKADKEALVFLAEICDGDARRALNALEIGCVTTPKDKNGQVHFSLAVAQESIQKKMVVYDRDGDAHYDTISAFIKSMRGSDPDATLYWLAKMIYAGEDVRFIARRISICAAEDVGNADPQALVLANSAMQAAEVLGLPEARIPLAQAAVYVACAPKSNSIIMGIDNALSDVKTKATQQVPNHLKDAHYKSAQKLGHGEGYKYAHNYKGHIVDQEYMPESKQYYEPSDMGYEAKIKQRLINRNKILNKNKE